MHVQLFKHPKYMLHLMSEKIFQFNAEKICIFLNLCFCWAVGHKMYGSQYRDHLSEIIRRAAEFCDCLQCFFVLHSMGGGKKI